MNDIMWDKVMVQEFESLVYLSEEETIVLHDWAEEKSVVNTSMRHNISTRQIDRIRNKIRKKYDAVQIYTPLLPPREET